MLRRVRDIARRLGGATPGDHAVLCRARDLRANRGFYQWFELRGGTIEAAEAALSAALADAGAALEEIEEWRPGTTPIATETGAMATSARVYYPEDDAVEREN